MSTASSMDFPLAARGPGKTGDGIFYVAESGHLLPNLRRKMKNRHEKFRYNISLRLLITSKQC
jgi:hypothetical protein